MLVNNMLELPLFLVALELLSVTQEGAAGAIGAGIFLLKGVE